MVAIRKRSENFVETRIDDEILLVDLDGGELLSLSGTGCELWALIDGSRNEADIARALADRYDAEPSIVEDDVGLCLADLEAAGLVERAALSSREPV